MHTMLHEGSLASVECDLLVLGVCENQLVSTLEKLGDIGTDLAVAAQSDEFAGKEGTQQQYATLGRISAPRVMLVGLGDGTVNEADAAAGFAGSLARDRGARRIAVDLGGIIDASRIHRRFLEGNYRFDIYKGQKSKKAIAEELLVYGSAEGNLEEAAAICAGQYFARDLVNEPAAAIYPETMAERAQSMATERMTVDVWDVPRLREARMGGIIGVGQGSTRPPRLIHCHYRPAGEPTRRIAMVGKGVTFDSGGLSIKPSSGMLTMRCDMAGGATVLGVMRAIAAIEPDVEIHGIVGAAENMTGGDAMKLGDILEMHNGKSVEVHNTDAEGRLVMADCLAFASKLGVDELIDVATLTGACVVALGEDYAGLFSESDALAEKLLGSAQSAGEGLWRLPMPKAYKKKLKAEWGDIKNLGDRWGGAITAALFLSEFVDGPEWAHLDIAGPAFHERKHHHYASGATGTLVATLTQWATGQASGS